VYNNHQTKLIFLQYCSVGQKLEIFMIVRQFYLSDLFFNNVNIVL